jgi:hypothetical protein
MAPDLMAANKLPALMRELGYACTASEAAFLKLLSQAPRVDEPTAAEVLSVMITSLKGLEDNLGLHATLNTALDGGYLGEPGSTTWNFNVVVDAIKRSSPQLDWAKVADALDTPAFLVPDQQAFLVLAAAYKRATGGQLPAKAFVGRLWANAMGQASFLKFAVAAAPETFSFAGSEQRIEALEALQGGKAPLGGANQAWASIDLLSVLCKLEQGAPQQLVRQMVDVPLKLCPEVLLVAMASVVPEGSQWPPLQREVRRPPRRAARLPCPAPPPPCRQRLAGSREQPLRCRAGCPSPSRRPPEPPPPAAGAGHADARLPGQQPQQHARDAAPVGHQPLAGGALHGGLVPAGHHPHLAHPRRVPGHQGAVHHPGRHALRLRHRDGGSGAPQASAWQPACWSLPAAGTGAGGALGQRGSTRGGLRRRMQRGRAAVP